MLRRVLLSAVAAAPLLLVASPARRGPEIPGPEPSPVPEAVRVLSVSRLSELAPPVGRVARTLREHAAAGPAAAVASPGRSLARARLERRRPDGAAAPRARRERPTLRRLAMLEASGLLRRRGEGFEVAGVQHVPVEVRKHGLPFLNRGGRLHERAGLRLGMAGGVGFPPLAERVARLRHDEAVTLAVEAGGVSSLRAEPRVRLGWFAQEGRSRLAFEVTVPARVPLAAWRVVLDASNGEVLRRVDLLREVDGSGRVHRLDPRQTRWIGNQPLRELDGSGRLAGRIVRVFDLRETEALVPDLDFSFPEEDPRFSQTHVYRGLTETGLLAERHGFPPFPAPLVTTTNIPDPLSGGELNNAFYDPTIAQFGFGNGDGVTLGNLALDIDVAAHEMGHHVFETLVQPQIFTTADPALAMHEGVADAFAMLVGGNGRIGDSVVPGAPFLRTLWNSRRFPRDLSPSPHETGLIYGGAAQAMRAAFGADAFAVLLIAALPFLPPDPIEVDFRDAFLRADQILTGGRRIWRLRQIFRARGFDEMELPDGFRGDLEAGVPVAGFLPDGAIEFWVFTELPPVSLADFRLSGTGDADLLVASANHFDERDPSTFAFSGNFFTSNERVVLSPGSVPSLDLDDVWIVAIGDFPDGAPSSYQLNLTTTLPADHVQVDGPPLVDSIDDTGEIDLFLFSGTAGQHVQVDARQLSGSIDPLVAVLDFEALEVLAADDDSGGDLDAHIQGARLPATGRYVVAVLSAIADVDPRVGTGSYELTLRTCVETGPDSDGDGSVDVCDDDDDSDGFADSQDSDRLDPLACADFDFDGCDDCSGGGFDPMNDGPDADGDGVCDAGDPDDDNDGCEDGVDPVPFAPSTDPDVDLLGSDCDVCPEVPDPIQADADGDGVGDACSVCGRVVWSEPVADPPDQNPRGTRVQVANAHLPGRSGVWAIGDFNPVGVLPLDPVAHGVRMVLADAGGALLDLDLPPGGVGSGCGPRDGWRETTWLNGTRLWRYENASGAIDPPLCTPGSARGFRWLVLKDQRHLWREAIQFELRMWGATLLQPVADPVRFLQLDLVAGNAGAPGALTPEGAAGECAEAVLRPDGAHSRCWIQRSFGGEPTSVFCRSQ